MDTTMTKDRPGIAVIGCGAWGMNHVRVWRELGCLRAACDLDALRLEAVHARYPELGTCSAPEVVLTDPDITAVVIASVAPTHADLTLKALKAGKDVLVEKPMALNAAAGKHLVEVAQHLGRILMVGHILEYHPAVQKLRDLIKVGALGRVQYIYSNRLNLGRIRTEESALWSFAPHDLAILLRLLEVMPEEVTCHGGAYITQEVADVTLTYLRFPGNVHTHIFVSWLHPLRDHRFIVVGDRQMAVFDDTRPWAEKLMLYPHRVDWVGGQVPVAHKADAVAVPLEEVEPLRAEAEHFWSCVRTRQQPLTDGESGLRVLQILEAAQHSIEKGGLPVHLGKEAAASLPYYVHPTACVDSGAEIGEGTRIWHFSHIMAEAKIGSNCVLGQNTFIGRRVCLGDGVKIQNNVSIYEGVELEDQVFCGPSMVFTNVINPRSEIERKQEFRNTLVRRGATLGANCTIVCGVTIGEYAFIGAGAVVVKDVPAFALVVGNPAKIIGWMCMCGTRIDFHGEDGSGSCRVCQQTYHKVGQRVSRS